MLPAGNASEVSTVHPHRRVPRRRFLAGLVGTAAALALDPAGVLARKALAPSPDVPLPPSLENVNNPALDGALTHFAWVWQFRHDGDREQIRDILAEHGLGIVLKTHDGTTWMSAYDRSADAVSGPEQISNLAAFFESGGVPFHAWYNAHGVDPVAEGEMAADVLGAGARSLFIDLEAHSGFWRGTPETALQLGEVLRRQHPNAWLSTAIDPRPWEIGRIPLTEFATFTDEIAPQVYWSDFRTSANLNRFRREGHDPGSIEGITPSFVLLAAMSQLSEFGLPIHPIGDGSVDAPDGWSEFLDQSLALNAESVSVWRFGNIEPGIFQLLKDTPPRPINYTVQAGDTLGALANAWGVDLDEVIRTNDITNPNLISIGQRLVLPRTGGRGAQLAAPAPEAAGGGAYTLEWGDSLWGLAQRWGTTVEEIARVNSIGDPSLVQVGQTLTIP